MKRIILSIIFIIITASAVSASIVADYGRMSGKDNYWNEGTVKYESQTTKNKAIVEASLRSEKTNDMVKGRGEYRINDRPIYFFGDINYEKNDALKTDEIFGGGGIGLEVVKVEGAATIGAGADYSLLVKQGVRSRFRAKAIAEYSSRKLLLKMSYIVPSPEFKAECEMELILSKAMSLVQVVEFSHMNEITDYSESTKIRMKF